MSKKERITIAIVNTLLMAIGVVGMIFLFPKLEWYIKGLAYAAIAIFSVGTYIFLAVFMSLVGFLMDFVYINDFIGCFLYDT